MHRLPQIRANTDIPQAEGCGGAGLEQAQQETSRFKVHTITELDGTQHVFRHKSLKLEAVPAYWHEFWCARNLTQQDQRPHDHGVDQRNHDRRAAHILGPFDEQMVLQ